MELWITSDHHFHHENIIRYSNRPFSNVKEMDEYLIDQWNSHVKANQNHHVYHLGDVTLNRGGRIERERFIKLIRSLHGHKRLVLGNHDHFPTKVYLDAGFEKIYAIWRGIGNIWLTHVPIHPDSMSSAIANVHGHIHDRQSPKPVVRIDKNGDVIVKPYINVCVEQTNYAPIHLDEVLQRIKSVSGV